MSQVSLVSKKWRTDVSHRLGEGVVLGREHAAEAEAVFSQDAGVELDISLEPSRGVRQASFDSSKGFEEALRIAGEQGAAELRLAGEVVVKAGSGDLELRRDVSVAEGVETTPLHQPLGDVEDARLGIRCGRDSLSPPTHRYHRKRVIAGLKLTY